MMWTTFMDFTVRLLTRLPGLRRWESGWRDSYGNLGPPSLSEGRSRTESRVRKSLASGRTVQASIELTFTLIDGSTFSLIGQGTSTQSREVAHLAGVTSMLSLRPAVRVYSRSEEAAGIAGSIASVAVKSCPMDLIEQVASSAEQNGI